MIAAALISMIWPGHSLRSERRPYVYPGTTTLRNRFGLTDPADLDRIERFHGANRGLEPIPRGAIDLTRIAEPGWLATSISSHAGDYGPMTSVIAGALKTGRRRPLTLTAGPSISLPNGSARPPTFIFNASDRRLLKGPAT